MICGSIPGRNEESLFSIMSRWALGPAQPHIQCAPGLLSTGVMWPSCEVDHSPPTSVKVKNEWTYASAPPGQTLLYLTTEIMS